jgi:acetoin utilization protein AcuB
MLVREFMTTTLTCLQETDSLLDATMIFVRSTFRHLPVLRGKQLVGVVTERDVKQFVPTLLTKITPQLYNEALENTPISRVMAHNPLTVKPGQSMFEAASTLFNKRIGCLPVVENGELKGIVTTTDMLRLLLRLLKDQPPRSTSPASR